MFTKSDIIEYGVKSNTIIYNKDTDMIKFFNDSDIKENWHESKYYVQVIKEHLGQSFKSIYSEHVSLLNVIECTKCGTVIFEKEDENWEENLCCPICRPDYHTGFEYWTKEDIESNTEMQEMLKLYKKLQNDIIEADKRYYKRGKLYDFEITHKHKIFKNKKWFIDWQIQKLISYTIKINVWKRTSDSGSTCKHAITIPLTFNNFIYYIKNRIPFKVTWKNV